MRYRHQVLRNLEFGMLGRFKELQAAKNELLVAADLTPYAIWAPAFGGLHHMVLEAEYDSMASFEEEWAAAKALEGYGDLNAQQLECVIPGTAEDRLQRLSAPPR